jgi:C1A family cysteine protease
LAKYGKSYATKEEYNFRLELFTKTMTHITKENARNDITFTMAVNQFADWTDEEYKRLLSYKPPAEGVAHHYVEFPQSNGPIDWRQQGKISGVRNQGSCGSCWAFSAVSAMEGAYAIKHGSLKALSEQQLVDCSGSYGNQGCNGGWYDAAFRYGRDYGMMSQSSYPYAGYQQYCYYNAGSVVAKVSTYNNV